MSDGEHPIRRSTLDKVERRYGQGESARSTFCAAPTSRSGPGSPSRWSRRRAPASRRCCISPACWRSRTPARSTSTAADRRRMADDERTALRRIEIGFVYQFHHLLPEFSALENVDAAAVDPRACRARRRASAAAELLAYLGLGARLTHRPAELSGGEQQRVAIARARRQRAAHPAGRRADRQPRSADLVACFRTLTLLVKQTGLAALVATHNLDLAARMDRRVTLRDGQVVELP